MHPKIYLKPGKEKPLLAHHHWVFSGAILKADPGVRHGGIVDLYAADHKFMGTGYYNEKTSIAVRVLSFTPAPIDSNFFWDRIFRAWSLRQKLFAGHGTNAYRVCHGEGDFLPGLVIDRYDGGIVIQLQALGLEPFRQDLAEIVSVMMKPAFIYERSEGPSRAEEGLEPATGALRGELPAGGVGVEEDGIRFTVDVAGGQKTGFFLDQRDNRRLVRDVARDRTVLNCFGYTGAFSVAAALGGATRTVTVDTSAPALEAARANFRLNGLDDGKHGFVRANVMELLRKPGEKYDLVVLDPPAFAKRQSAAQAAFHGYKDVNLHAMKTLNPGGWLLTCSCSAHVDAATFQKIVFAAAVDAGRNVQILRKLAQPMDHPVNVFHPETEYLKALLVRVT
ncbi:MAG: class I SAM-dependent rRNA methyltransferase [Acidobacteria bacterium]|nr:class I SAM-dependent rRNA methyltransferase [Acidobacteriota bacterium]